MFDFLPSHPASRLAAAVLQGLLLVASAAHAAGPADLEPLRQQEREREVQRDRLHRRQDPPPATEAAPLPAYPARESPCMPIREVRLTGPESARLAFALAAVDARAAEPAVGRCLGATGIAVVVARVQAAIVARGYLTTRVQTPAQNLSAGELILLTIPGRVGTLRLAEGASPRANLHTAFALAPGALLDLRAIEQGLENLRRVPSAQAAVRIVAAPGAADADDEAICSDLVIDYAQPMPLRLTATVDDGGSAATGRLQGGLTLFYDNAWGLNDQFYASVNRDLGGGGIGGPRGTRGQTVRYSLPFGDWTAGLTYNEYAYRQTVPGAVQSYVYAGTGDTLDFRLARTLYRDATRRLGASLRAIVRHARNTIDDTEIEVQRRRTTAIEIGLQYRRHGDGASLEAALTWRQGLGLFGALPAPEEAFDEGSSRAPFVGADVDLTLPFAVVMPWGPQAGRYRVSVRGQLERAPLTAPDRFVIGGRHSVRGFDGQSALLADRGWLIRNELALGIGASGAECFLGLDHGRVGGPAADLLPGRRLTGAVLGLRGEGAGWLRGLGYEGFVAMPLARPEGFRTAPVTAGFLLSWRF